MPRHSHRRSYSKRSIKGGDGYQHTISVYGDMGQQHSQSGSNVIANDGGKMPVDPTPVKGGSRKRRGGNLTGFAAAGILAVASQMYGRKNRTMNKKHRTSRKNYTGKKFRSYKK